MRPALLTAIVLFIFTVPAKAQTVSTETVYERCKSLIDSKADFDSGFCAGFLDAVIQSQFVFEVNDPGKAKTYPMKWCFTPDVTNLQIIKVFMKFVDDHPEQLNKFPALLLQESLVNAFPCHK